MSEPSGRAIFEAFLRAMNARDLDTVEALLHPDFEDFYPQSGERTRGFANLRAIMENYPGGFRGRGARAVAGAEDRWVMTPALSVIRIEGTGDTYTGVSRGRYPDGSDWYIVTIARIRDGKVWRGEQYFAQEFEPPAWRSEWVEVERTEGPPVA